MNVFVLKFVQEIINSKKNLLTKFFFRNTGYKMAMPNCRNRVTGVDVEESLCNAALRPEPTVVQCNTHLCPPKWIADEWSPCNKVCGTGTRDRLVVCAEESNGVKHRVPDEACRGLRPKIIENCNIHECPKWQMGTWSGVSSYWSNI